LDAEQKTRLARAEAALRQQFAKEAATHTEKLKREAAGREAGIRKQAAEAATAALATKMSEAEQARKTAEAQVKAIRASTEDKITQRLAAQRETLAKHTAEAVNAEKVKAFEEKTRLTEQLAEMQRRLERKTAHELGEPAEVDLFETLQDAFPNDRVWRVVKGQPGPDVVIEILHNDAVAGKIVLDSKNHARWSNRFALKLREDQRAEGADFAILSSSTFPKGARQLHVQDGVIVADPARVVVLVNLLRRQIIQAYLLKLSIQDRNAKADRLLDYIVSPQAGDLFDRLRKTADDMVNLEAKEVEAHHGVWRRRGELIHAVQRMNEDLSSAIDSIVGGMASVVEEAAP
jgi:hypothetical protein